MSHRVVHFEIGADNPERIVQFYSKVFDWKIETWSGPMEYWLCQTGEKGQPGIDGAIMRADGPQRIINTIDVPSVDEFMAKVTEAGGTVIHGKSPIPHVGWFAYCADPEGTTFGIMQADPSVE